MLVCCKYQEIAEKVGSRSFHYFFATLIGMLTKQMQT